MKKLIPILPVLLLFLVFSPANYAQDSKPADFPETVKKFNEELLSFLDKGDYSFIDSYITPATQLIKGKRKFNVSSEDDKASFIKEFKDGSGSNGINFNAWTSEGKYIYMLFESSPTSESTGYNSILLQVTDNSDVKIQVWHKS